jgi:hypothetical protein
MFKMEFSLLLGIWSVCGHDGLSLNDARMVVSEGVGRPTSGSPKRPKKAHVDVTPKIAVGMQHVNEFMAGRAPEADEAIADMAIGLRPRIGL